MTIKMNFLLNKKLKLWLLGGLSVFALMTVSADFLNQNVFYKTVLSANSLEALKELNYQYEFSVSKELVSGDSHPDLISELSLANVLEDASEADKSGLIVTMDETNGDGAIILLKSPNTIPEENLQEIADEYEARIPEFENVEIDQKISLEGYPVYGFTEEAADTVTSKQAPKSRVSLASESTGTKTIKVAVIDSGIDTSHEIFKKVKLQNGWNTLENNSKMYDDVGHGTHMAGIVAQYAPGVTIIPYKIASKTGGELSNVLMGVQMAIDAGANIINASFGVENTSYALEKLIKKAKSKGVIVVAAAGNSDTTGPFFPAEFSDSIAVASLGQNGEKMPHSNYGYWVDLAAIGEKVYSALPGGIYGYKNGTSPATAYVSAQVASLMKKNGLMNSSQILSYFTSPGSKKIAAGKLAGVTVVK